MDFLSQLLRGIAFVPALVSGIESLFASKSWGPEKRCRDVVSGERAGHGRCRRGARDCGSRKIQRGHLTSGGRSGRVPERVNLEQTTARCESANLCFVKLADFFVPILQRFLHQSHELVGYGAVDKAVIVAEREVNDGADRDGIVAFFVGDHQRLLVIPPTPIMAEFG